MEHDPSVDHTLQEAPPTETERKMGMLTTGVIALLVVGTAIYWMA
ncbi:MULTISPECIES: hypothetical protein [unclassified Bradyrhizobium]|nr:MULTISPECIES: hypothetical protein [unclassified Bradyrhizobium]